MFSVYQRHVVSIKRITTKHTYRTYLKVLTLRGATFRVLRYIFVPLHVFFLFSLFFLLVTPSPYFIRLLIFSALLFM